MEIPLLGQNNGQGAAKPREVVFAVLLTRDADGTTLLSTDISTPVTAERQPNPGELLDALHNAYENIKAQQYAAVILNGMVGMSRMAMESQQAEAMMRNLQGNR